VDMDERTVAVYGGLDATEGGTIRAAASFLGLGCEQLDTPAALASELERGLPAAVLVAMRSAGAVEVFAHLRGQVRFAGVPVVALSSERNDGAFSDVYEHGVDDLASPRSMRAIVARLRAVIERRAAGARAAAHGGGAGVGAGGGDVVVAGTGLRWRTVVARMLSNAGLRPRIAGNVPDAVDAACSRGVRFVVACDDLPPDGAAAALFGARSRGGVDVPWVVVAPARRLGSLRVVLGGLPRVALVDVHAPPDNVLYVANDLSRSQLSERRASARLLFGTAVAFRVAGSGEDDVGFTYNVAAGGMFVRTLAAPRGGDEVWLELWPPRSERAVRLVGSVAWSRPYGPSDGANVPPGFGVRLTGGLPGDLERWEAAYRSLAAQPSPALRNVSGVPPALAASTVT
jgi:hypothetical protein